MIEQNNKFRILILTHLFPPSIGGAEKQSELLAREFSKRGSQVIVFTDRYNLGLPTKEIMDNFAIHRITSISFIRLWAQNHVASMTRNIPNLKLPSGTSENRSFSSFIYSFVRAQYRLIFYIAPILSYTAAVFFKLILFRSYYGLIVVFQMHWLAVPAVIAGYILRKPVIIREAAANEIDILDSFPLRSFTKSLVMKNRMFIVLSRQAAEMLESRGVPAANIHYIPNTVETVPAMQLKNTASASVLFIGNVTSDARQKGLDILLNAWSSVIRIKPDARLTIVGHGNYSPFKELARQLNIQDSVIFFGISEDLPKIFSEHNIFILPSRYEGMSNALLEAMASGRACIVSAIPGNIDLIRNGDNGIAIPVEDIRGLSDAILTLMQNPGLQKQLGDAARMDVTAFHSVESMVSHYTTIFDECNH